MNESVALLAVLGAVLGASLNTIRAWLEAPQEEKYSFKKLTGALIGSSLFAFTIVNFVDIPTQYETFGQIGLFILMAVSGAGMSAITHRSNK